MHVALSDAAETQRRCMYADKEVVYMQAVRLLERWGDKGLFGGKVFDLPSLPNIYVVHVTDDLRMFIEVKADQITVLDFALWETILACGSEQ